MKRWSIALLIVGALTVMGLTLARRAHRTPCPSGAGGECGSAGDHDSQTKGGSIIGNRDGTPGHNPRAR